MKDKKRALRWVRLDNAAKIIREITEADKNTYYKNRPIDAEAIRFIEELKK